MQCHTYISLECKPFCIGFLDLVSKNPHKPNTNTNANPNQPNVNPKVSRWNMVMLGNFCVKFALGMTISCCLNGISDGIWA